MADSSPNPYAPPAASPTVSSARPLIPIFVIVFIDVLGLTLIIPILPYYAQRFGATDLDVGLLLSSFAICQFFASPVLGRVSDRVGRKPVLITSQLGMVASYLVLGFARALWTIYLGRVIAGITAGNLSIAQAYIADVTKPENRTKSYGIIGVAFGLGFMFGPPIAGLLSSRLGPATPFYAAAGLSLASSITTSILLPNVTPAPRPQAASRTDDVFALFRRAEPRDRLLQFFAFQLAFSTMMSGFSLYLQHRFHFNEEQTGYMFLFSGVVGAIIQGGLLGRIVRRLGERRLAIVGFISMAVGFAFIGLAPTVVVLLVMLLFGNFGGAVTRPALTTLLTKTVGPEAQGQALGVSASLTSVTQIVCPIIATGLIHNEHLVGYGLVIAAFSAVGAVLVVIRREPEQAPAPEADVTP